MLWAHRPSQESCLGWDEGGTGAGSDGYRDGPTQKPGLRTNAIFLGR